jgi:hypothetical protein
MTASALRLTEAQLERQVCDYLASDGWICRKMEQNYNERKRKAVGEKGMADRLCIRYAGLGDDAFYRSEAEVLWIEFKRAIFTKRFTRAEKARIEQRAWHALERQRGALTLIAGEDFPPTIDGFREWYKASGLARRVK